MKPIYIPTLRVNKFLIIAMVILVSGILIIYMGLRVWIKSDIDKHVSYAVNQYGGDRVEALIGVLNSETAGLKAKNDAIWTLTYIGDQRALPVLKSLQTGQECDHDRSVCQRELKRAIAQIEGTRFSVMHFKK
ncbi:MAG TPA: hypothetical protein VFG54_08180 [Prolixibacteraceae bacterium]|nr:hypothetical protein [Prolixibacteraceae bacterium]